MEKFRMLTHRGPLGVGYRVSALCDADGCYHVALAGWEAPVYKLDAALTTCLGESGLSHDYVVTASGRQYADYSSDGYRPVRGAELSSVRAVFDTLCFCDLPVYFDETAEHLSQLAAFNAFCAECGRRRKADPTLDEAEDTGLPPGEPCTARTRAECVQFWCARHRDEYRDITPRVRGDPRPYVIFADDDDDDDDGAPGEYDGHEEP